MSYRSIINANADMLNKAEKMYQSDRRNIMLSTGASIDEVDRKESVDAINDKLNLLQKEKEQALQEVSSQYHRDTAVLQALHDNEAKSDFILKKQYKELKYNKSRMVNMKADVMTMRRQVEISQDVTKRRNNKTFILRATFVYLMLLIIPVMLMKNKTLDPKWAHTAIGALTVLYVLQILWVFWFWRDRNPLRVNVRHWKKPNLKKVLSESKLSEADKESIEESKRKANMTELEKLVEQLEEDLETALDEENYNLAANCRARLDAIRHARVSGEDELGGYSSIDAIRADMKKFKDGRTKANAKMVAILNAKVKKYEAENAAARGRVKAYMRRQTNRDKEDDKLAKNLEKMQDDIDRRADEIEQIRDEIKELKDGDDSDDEDY